MKTRYTKFERFIINHGLSTMTALFTIGLIIIVATLLFADYAFVEMAVAVIFLQILAVVINAMRYDIVLHKLVDQQRQLDEEWGEIAVEAYLAMMDKEDKGDE